MSGQDDSKAGPGHTLAEAEWLRYTDAPLARQLTGRIKRAEEKYGYTTGVRKVPDGDGFREIRVSVSFYQGTKFWICDMVDGKAVNGRELTDEEYGTSQGLKLF